MVCAYTIWRYANVNAFDHSPTHAQPERPEAALLGTLRAARSGARLALRWGVAVQRHGLSRGASPLRQLSLRPVATGAAVAAILRGKAKSPVIVHTPAGQLTVRWEGSVYLTGPAEFIGEGVYFLPRV